MKGGGTCGFDTVTQSFMCLCKDGNSTTHCKGMLKILPYSIELCVHEKYVFPLPETSAFNHITI